MTLAFVHQRHMCGSANSSTSKQMFSPSPGCERLIQADSSPVALANMRAKYENKVALTVYKALEGLEGYSC